MAAIYATVYGIVLFSVLPQLFLIYTSFLKTSGMVFVKAILKQLQDCLRSHRGYYFLIRFAFL